MTFGARLSKNTAITLMLLAWSLFVCALSNSGVVKNCDEGEALHTVVLFTDAAATHQTDSGGDCELTDHLIKISSYSIDDLFVALGGFWLLPFAIFFVLTSYTRQRDNRFVRQTPLFLSYCVFLE